VIDVSLILVIWKYLSLCKGIYKISSYHPKCIRK